MIYKVRQTELSGLQSGEEEVQHLCADLRYRPSVSDLLRQMTIKSTTA